MNISPTAHDAGRDVPCGIRTVTDAKFHVPADGVQLPDGVHAPDGEYEPPSSRMVSAASRTVFARVVESPVMDILPVPSISWRYLILPAESIFDDATSVLL
jgi:hypothetical protein